MEYSHKNKGKETMKERDIAGNKCETLFGYKNGFEVLGNGDIPTTSNTKVKWLYLGMLEDWIKEQGIWK